MKLGVCIIKSSYGKSNKAITEASVKKLSVDLKVYHKNSFKEVQQHLCKVKEDWTLVLYDREELDQRFNNVITIILADKEVDAFKFFCVVKTHSNPFVIDTVRLFRKGILLRYDSLRPTLPNAYIIRLLDGWIFEQGTKNVVHKIQEFGATKNIKPPKQNSISC